MLTYAVELLCMSVTVLDLMKIAVVLTKYAPLGTGTYRCEIVIIYFCGIGTEYFQITALRFAGKSRRDASPCREIPALPGIPGK